MRKILLPLLILAMVALMSCNIDDIKDENINPETGKPYYGFEVKILSYSQANDDNHKAYLNTITWKNPTDENFSHVDIIILSDDPNIGISCHNEIETEFLEYRDRSHTYRGGLYCVDINGNKSKGVLFHIDPYFITKELCKQHRACDFRFEFNNIIYTEPNVSCNAIHLQDFIKQ